MTDWLRSLRAADFTDDVSMVASGRHVEQPGYQRWLPVLGQTNGRHRKVWEWCYILQALENHDLLHAGVSAVGFGVGTEPLVAALAARGVKVLATDQAAEQAGEWGVTGQHATAVDSLRRPDLCNDAQSNWSGSVPSTCARFQAISVSSMSCGRRAASNTSAHPKRDSTS